MSVILLERAWTIIANAGGGDWTKESKEWQKAAAEWRDDFHAAMTRELSRSPMTECQLEQHENINGLRDALLSALVQKPKLPRHTKD